MNIRELSDVDKDGRCYMATYDADPFYVKPGLLNRWGPSALWVRFLGGSVPGKGFVPEGYSASYLDIGPVYTRGKGEAETMKNEDELIASGVGTGCPFMKHVGGMTTSCPVQQYTE